MNTLFDSLRNMLGQGFSQPGGQKYQPGTGTPQGDADPAGSLQGVLGQLFADPKTGAGIPVLGGLLGAFAGKNAITGAAGGALLMKGLQMFAQHSDRMRREAAVNPENPVARNYLDATARPSGPDERAARIIRALVYAAKSDGHIDDGEREAIMGRLQSLGLGAEGEALVRQAMEEPVNPRKIAAGVKTPEEALEAFTVSCAVPHADGFMVNVYLNELARELAIPDDVRDDLIAKIGTAGSA